MDEATRLTIKIADLMKERDELIDRNLQLVQENLGLIQKCQHKNTTLNEAYTMLTDEEEGDSEFLIDNVAEYIKERERFD